MSLDTEQRSKLTARRKALHYAAMAEGRDLTEAEQAEFHSIGAALDEQSGTGRQTYASSPLGKSLSTFTTNDAPSRTIRATGSLSNVEAFRRDNPELAKDTGEFSHLGEFLAAIGQKVLGREDKRLDACLASRRGSEFSSMTGLGYVVPAGHSLNLLESNVISGDFPLFANCTKVPMTTKTGTFPVFADTTHAASPCGITWATIPESGEFTEQGVNIEVVELSAHKRGAIFYIPSETIADAGAGFTTAFENALITSIGWDIEHQLWNGVGGVVGALGGGGEVTITKEGGQAADTLVSANLAKMWASMLPGHYSKSIWVANEATKPQLANLSISAGTSGQIVGLAGTDRGMVLPPPEQILGRPAYYSECVPTLGDEGDINLLDPTAYVFGLVLAPVVEADRSYRFNKDQVAFRVKYRAAGRPLMRTTFTPHLGDTRGWLVNIAAR